MVEGSLEYAAKLAQLTLQFGQSILDAGLNIFDMIADALSAKLKGLNPCGALASDFSAAPDGSVKAQVVSSQYASGLNQVTEIVSPKVIFDRIKKPIQGKLNIATASSFTNNRLQANKMADVKFTEDGVAYVEEGGLKISLLVDEDGNYEKR